MKKLLFAALLIIPFVLQSSPSHLQLIEQNRNESPNKKLEKASQHFLGTPSGWTQRTESKKEKSEEVLSVDVEKLDCMTFIETALALSLAQSTDGFLEELKNMRYANGVISFQTRLHFPEADWIPHQIKRGALINVTPQIAHKFDQNSLKTASAEISRLNWMKALFPHEVERYEQSGMPSRSIAQLDYIDFDAMWTVPDRTIQEQEAFQTEEQKLFSEMLSASDTRKSELQRQLDVLRKNFRLKGATLKKDFVEALPEISLVSLVRPTHAVIVQGQKLTDMLVTHMGFVIRKEGDVIFRHAPARGNLQVSDVKFEDYFSNFLVTGSNTDSVSNRRSTWRGLNFLTLNE